MRTLTKFALLTAAAGVCCFMLPIYAVTYDLPAETKTSPPLTFPGQIGLTQPPRLAADSNSPSIELSLPGREKSGISLPHRYGEIPNPATKGPMAQLIPTEWTAQAILIPTTWDDIKIILLSPKERGRAK